MKPAPFDYQAPGTLREAIDLLASNPEASALAKDGTGEPVVLAQGGGVTSLAVLADGRLAGGGLRPRVSLGTARGPVLRK